MPVRLLGLLCLLLPGASAFAESGGAEDERVLFVGEATLGTNLYELSSPFDDSSLGGFFDQWRYIEGKGDKPPYYVDLFHLDMGFQRPDETYLTRFEFFSPNHLNERGVFELDWRGLGLDVNYRRHRGDLLRFFPSGTGEGFGVGELPGYGSRYCETLAALCADPGTPGAAFLAPSRRFWITRQGMDGTLSLDFDGLGWGNPVLQKLSIYGDYQARTGYRQDSFLRDEMLGQFRGERREIDQRVATVGVAALVFPFEVLTAKLDVKLQRFSERAPQDEDFGVVPHFVPDTNRITARLDVSKRWTRTSFTLGGFVTHLEQTGAESPLQTLEMLAQNSATSYSLWSSFDADLPSYFELTGHAKWSHRKNAVDPKFSTLQTAALLRSTGRFKANLELGARPLAGTRLALGYRVEYAHRDLDFGGPFPPTAGPEASVIRPDSLHHFFYLAGRTRPARGLQLRGELGYDWGPEVAYPNEFGEAVYFSGRGSYTPAVSLPVVLSVSGRVVSGESPGYRLSDPVGPAKSKRYQRLAWNYDATATVVPIPRLSLFATFAHHYDDQTFRHLRVDDQRLFGGAFFIDSDPNYRTEVKSLSAGGSVEVSEKIDLSAGMSLTWTRADYPGDSVTEIALHQANEIDTRIIALESDLDYEVVEGLEFSIGYRLQQYRDREVQEVLDYSSTVHTLTLRATLDFNALASLVR